MTTLAWHNRPELKAEAVARLKAHRRADTIVQGIYQQIDPESATGYRGCAIGCTLPKLAVDDGLFDEYAGNGHWWARIETEYGIPYEVARAIDNIFEGQPSFHAAADFAVKVIEAIPVGADLTDVVGKTADDGYYYYYYCCSCCDTRRRHSAGDAAELLIADLAAAPVPATAGAP